MISFVYPQVFLFMFFPAIVFFYLMLTNKKKKKSVFAKDVLDKLILANKSFLKPKSRMILLFASLILMIIAFARPVIDKGEKKIFSKGLEIIAGIDISKSMDTQDIYPNRLKASFNRVKTLLKNLHPADKIAIFSFAKESFLISPLTTDKNIAKYLLSFFDTSKIKDKSSNLQTALKSTKYLSKEKNPILILFSDGDEGDLKDVIDFAKKNSIKVYAIGMATQKGGVVPKTKDELLKDKNGNIVFSSLNKNLKNLSLQTGGAYINCSFDDVLQILKQIRKDTKTTSITQDTIRDFTELFYYPLFLALVLLLISFSSIPKKILAIWIVLLLTEQKGYCISFDFKTMSKAKELYRAKKYQQAIINYEKLSHLSKTQEAAKLHNIGNCYFKIKDYKKAIKYYQKSLKNSFNKDTKFNLELAKKMLKKQSKKQKQKSKNHHQNKTNSQNSKSKNQNKKNQNLYNKTTLKKIKMLKKSNKQESRVLQKLDNRQKYIPLKRLHIKTKKPNQDKYW